MAKKKRKKKQTAKRKKVCRKDLSSAQQSFYDSIRRLLIEFSDASQLKLLKCIAGTAPWHGSFEGASAATADRVTEIKKILGGVTDPTLASVLRRMLANRRSERKRLKTVDARKCKEASAGRSARRRDNKARNKEGSKDEDAERAQLCHDELLQDFRSKGIICTFIAAAASLLVLVSAALGYHKKGFDKKGRLHGKWLQEFTWGGTFRGEAHLYKRYEGDFHHGQRHGYGTLTWADRHDTCMADGPTDWQAEHCATTCISIRKPSVNEMHGFLYTASAIRNCRTAISCTLVGS